MNFYQLLTTKHGNTSTVSQTKHRGKFTTGFSMTSDEDLEMVEER